VPRPGQLGVVYAGIPCGRCPRCREGLSHYCQEGHSLGTGGPFGGLGEYLLAPAESFLPAPEGSDPAVLTFCEPLANGIRCLDQPELREARSALARVVEGDPDARPLVTRRIGLDEVPGATIDLAAGADEIKVVVEHDRR